MAELSLLNFYAPLVNFLVFAVLFYFAFRLKFREMALGQKQRFDQALRDGRAQREQAQKQLDLLLFEERELAKKLRAILEQAKKDSAERAAQIVQDAQFHADQILEESQRLMDAAYESFQNELQHSMLQQLYVAVDERLSEQLTPDKHRQYDDYSVQRLAQLSLPSGVNVAMRKV